MKKYSIYTFLLMIVTCSLNAQHLESYYQIAAMNNPGLMAKYKSFEASMQSVRQVKSLPDPTLSFGYFISPVETRVGPQKARLSISQLFPWFGSLKKQENAAALMAEAKYQEFLDERNKLFYQVALAYYPLYELQQLIRIEEENRRILSSYKEISLLRYQNNKGSMVDFLRVDIMLEDVITQLSILEGKRKPLQTRFNKLLNRDASESIEIEDTLLIKDLAENYRKDSLLTSNPLLDELALKVQASKASEQAAVKQGLPKLGLGLDYVVVNPRTDMAVSDNGKDVLMPMLSISLPIFRGKYKAAEKEAQLMQESFSFQREAMLNKLISSYDMLYFELQQYLDFIHLYETQVKTSEQSLQLLYTAYANAGKDFEEVLRMQQQVLKYQRMKITATTKYFTSLAEMDYLTAKSR